VCQSRVIGDREPVSSVSLSNSIFTASFVKNAVQPALQSWPIESSESEAKSGKTWAMQAARFGRSSSPTWLG
jgi:hypothetical protein